MNEKVYSEMKARTRDSFPPAVHEPTPNRQEGLGGYIDILLIRLPISVGSLLLRLSPPTL